MKTVDYCKAVAKEAADKIWEFQQAITGPAELSDSLSNEDIEALDAARIILDRYSGAYDDGINVISEGGFPEE